MYEESTVPVEAENIRIEMNHMEMRVKNFIDQIKNTEQSTTENGNVGLGQKGECIAQATIALRDLENSRMRLGKVIQYAGDGESIYDKKAE